MKTYPSNQQVYDLKSHIDLSHHQMASSPEIGTALLHALSRFSKNKTWHQKPIIRNLHSPCVSYVKTLNISSKINSQFPKLYETTYLNSIKPVSTNNWFFKINLFTIFSSNLISRWIPLFGSKSCLSQLTNGFLYVIFN